MSSVKFALLGLSIAVASATDSAAESIVCQPCPDNTPEVALLIHDTLFEETMKWRGQAESWFDVPRGMEYHVVPVNNASEIPGIIKRIARGCTRIGKLGIFSHGSLGNIGIGADSIHVANVADKFGDLGCVMSDSARVEFAGCNVGRGCRGENFMMSVAQALLNRGGGVVKAATSYTTGIGTYNIGSINFDNQYLYVRPGMRSTKWDNVPQSAEACRTRATEALADIEQIVTGCRLSSEMLNYLGISKKFMLESLKRSKGAATWAFPGTPYYNAGSSFWLGFQVYDYVKAFMGQCKSTREESNSGRAPTVYSSGATRVY